MDKCFITRGQVKIALRTALCCTSEREEGSDIITYDDGCRGVDIDWGKLDSIIDGIPAFDDLTLTVDDVLSGRFT